MPAPEAVTGTSLGKWIGVLRDGTIVKGSDEFKEFDGIEKKP